MFNPKPSSRPAKSQEDSSKQPKDALAALMDGETPDDKSLKFPDERTTSWRAKPSTQTSRPASGFQEDRPDYQFSKPNSAMGEFQPAKPVNTLDNVKSGAYKGGNYLKEKSVAGATYVKEKDWTKEKQMAGKAAVTTKNGAVIIGSGVAKGAGWLWNSGKSGVESLRSKDKK